jgi:hypothetical protein
MQIQILLGKITTVRNAVADFKTNSKKEGWYLYYRIEARQGRAMPQRRSREL